MGKEEHGRLGFEVTEKADMIARFLHSKRSNLEEAITKVMSKER